jgi:HlyD family secretion protein
MDQSQARVDGLLQRVEQARQNLDKAINGPRSEEIKAAESELEYARQSLRLLLAGSRAEDIDRALANIDAVQAQIRELEASLAEARVTAPADSVVLSTGYKPGDLIPPGGEVVRLLLVGTEYIQVFIPQDRLGWAGPGSTARIEVDTFPGEIFSGTVSYLSTQGEFTPRNLQTKEKRVEEVFRAKVRVDDRAGKLRPGMVCDVFFSRPGAAGNGG